ncbi:MAG: limonene-1,2-epoxide hydrolase family protein [Pseudomonadota bacterium]
MALNPQDGATEDERTVLHFCSLWAKQDVDGIVEHFTPDGEYIDMPLPPRRGHAEIRAYVEGIFKAFRCEIETLRIASAGSVVFTERVDYLTRTDDAKPTVPLPVAGIFEMKDGKIWRWREYLDLRTAEDGLALVVRSSGDMSDQESAEASARS